jgi:uncharacterized FAD-dependent dehydrogenase
MPYFWHAAGYLRFMIISLDIERRAFTIKENMSDIFDVCIVGTGVAGVFCAYRLASQHKGTKVIGIELGRPPAKRRMQMNGWLGALTTSDGKLYLNDLNKLDDIITPRRNKSGYQAVTKILSQIGDFQITKDRCPNVSLEKRIKKIGYDIILNDFIQIYPKDIHSLSKYMADNIEHNKNIIFSFDNEVKVIHKQKNIFCVQTENQEYRCKKLIIAAGRSGWRWAKDVFSSFGIIDSNDIARYGIRIEMNAGVAKDFNKSNCSLFKGQEIELGPFSWYGTVIPEDHTDMAVSSFRSNEVRWKSDKISFNLIGNRFYPNNGFEQTDRIGKLTFVITNDRIIKERVSYIMNNKSAISILPDYDWLKPVLTELSLALPEIITKAYYHSPTIIPMAPQINLGNNLESEIPGMFVIGENASIPGILGAMVSGIIAADAVVK